MKKTLIFLITIFCIFQYAKPNVVYCNYYNDSLFKLIKYSNNDTLKLKILKDVCNKKTSNNDTDALKFIEEGLQLSRKINNKYYEACFQEYKGIYYRINSDFAKSIDCLYKSLQIYENLNSKRDIAENLRVLGEAFRSSLNYKNSLDYLFKALKSFNELNDTYGIAKTTNRLAAVYYEIQLNYPPTAPLAFKYVNQSIELSKKLNDKDLLLNNLEILGAYYLSIKEYKKGISCLNESMSYIDSNSYIDLPNIQNNIASFYYDIGEYRKSIEFAFKAIESSRRVNLDMSLLVAFDVLAKDYYSLKDYKTAYIYNDSAFVIKNKLYFNSNNKHVLELQTIYETQQKEHELALANLEKTYLKYILIISSVFLILFLLILIFKNRLKSRANYLLKEKNEEITLQKEQLADNEIVLKDLIATKDKFFSIIAHDIKNPLISIVQVSELLKNDFLTFNAEELQEFIELLNKSASNLFDLLTNLLTWSRSQQGTITFNPVDIDINTIIKNISETLEFNAQQKNIKIINNIPENTKVFCDYNMISSVFRNLISNSIKFSYTDCQIIISSQKNDSYILFSVQDFGIGISEEDMTKLFRLDVHYTSIGTSSEKGTGIGLLLCKEFVEKHDGKIYVESQLNVGSKFIFTLKNIE